MEDGSMTDIPDNTRFAKCKATGSYIPRARFNLYMYIYKYTYMYRHNPDCVDLPKEKRPEYFRCGLRPTKKFPSDIKGYYRTTMLKGH